MQSYFAVRADASASIGSGHLLRCLALAQALISRGGQVAFVTACDNEKLLQLLQKTGNTIIRMPNPCPLQDDWEITASALEKDSFSWVILDGYAFDATYHQQIKNTGCRVLVIDDMAHLSRYCADVILNQNITAKTLHYLCESGTRLLLGTRYALLRTEFLAWQNWQREVPDTARKLLVTLGGGDPDNQTMKVIRALQQTSVDALEVKVVIGHANSITQVMSDEARKLPGHVEFIKGASNMPELMAWADLAVTAGGSTCLETAFMGLPSLIITIADNQYDISRSLHAHGSAISLGWWKDIGEHEIKCCVESLMPDMPRRRDMSRQGRSLVDGLGAMRVVDALEEQMYATY